MAISTDPVWEEARLPAFGGLTRNVSVDVAIIGAGITGVTAARLLTDAGLHVALLERRTIGRGDTGCTTAHLTAVVDTPLTTLKARFGRDHAQATWDAGLAAIDQIAALVETDALDCGLAWVPGFKHAPFDLDGTALDRVREELREEARLAAELGFDVRDVSTTPFVDRPGWRIEDQAVIDPRRYLRGLVEGLAASGVTIAEQGDVVFEDEPNVIRCGSHHVRAKHVFFATHNPHPGRLSASAAELLQSKLALYTTYAVALRLPSGAACEPGCYWDTASPYRYVRVDTDASGPRMIAGGEDHKTGQEANTAECFDRLERWLRRLVPDGKVTHRWSGQVIETHDGLPLIGDVAPGQYVATGYAGNGMTFGTLAAIMIRDAITGDRMNPWQDLFSPARSVLVHGPWNYLVENADYPYYKIRDRFAGASRRALRQIRRNDGAVIEHAGQVVAAARDARGETTLLSPVCTHRGCRVAWNRAERTWDCPCHGSRFKATGEVLAGPADTALDRLTVQGAALAPSSGKS